MRNFLVSKGSFVSPYLLFIVGFEFRVLILRMYYLLLLLKMMYCLPPSLSPYMYLSEFWSISYDLWSVIRRFSVGGCVCFFFFGDLLILLELLQEFSLLLRFSLGLHHLYFTYLKTWVRMTVGENLNSVSVNVWTLLSELNWFNFTGFRYFSGTHFVFVCSRPHRPFLSLHSVLESLYFSWVVPFGLISTHDSDELTLPL